MQILSLYFREIQNVECVLIDSFIILLLLRLPATKYLDEKKAGDFNRGESLNSPHTGYGPGAHQMEPPSLLISGVNPFPSRFINRTIFFVMRFNRMNALAACCHFSIFIGSFLYQRAKPPQGIVLFINLLGKGLTPRACMGDAGSI